MVHERPKLLVVEHDPYWIYLLRLYGERAGFSMVIVSQGDEALDLACRVKPHLIIVEADLPDISGWQVVQGLRATPEINGIPVVICLWQDGIRAARQELADSLLHKPITYKDFLMAVRRAGAYFPQPGEDMRHSTDSKSGEQASRSIQGSPVVEPLAALQPTSKEWSMSNEQIQDNILLEVKDLRKHFPIKKGFFSTKVVSLVKAVDGVSFFIRRGETLGLVGESGCGKTTTGRLILRAYEPTAGEIWFNDPVLGRVSIPDLDKQQLRRVRQHMQMIFQDPYSSLDPRMTLLRIVGEPLEVNDVAHGQELQDRVSELLRVVGLRPEYMTRYPHAFSGGQRQRIGIARALALNPQLVVCDEPVSALDVSIQAQTLNLLMDLQERFGLTYLFIAHDLSVVEHISDRVAVMYVGKLVEHAPTVELFTHPLHPYTEALLSAVPKPDPRLRIEPIVLPGEVADPANPPSGCYFHPRCRYAKDICTVESPVLRQLGPDHFVSCHRAEELTLAGVLDAPTAAPTRSIGTVGHRA